MAAQIRTDGLVDAERLRKVLGLLREATHRGITKTQLARKLGGVSARTVDRAIKLLEEQGARINKGRAGKPSVIHFVLQKGPAWDEHISTEVRQALRLAALTLSHSGISFWKHKLAILTDLVSPRLSTKDRRVFGQLQGAVQLQGGAADPLDAHDVLEPILRALEESKELELDYRSAETKRASGMRVVPCAFTHDLFSGGAFLLVWDPKGERPLSLRLGNILRAKPSARSGAIPEPDGMKRAAAYQIGGWTSTETPFQVKARIEGPRWVQVIKEVPPALPDFECTIAKNGESAEVRFKANHPTGASRWLLQFAEAAEVLEPAWLRKEIAERTSSAAARYRKK